MIYPSKSPTNLGTTTVGAWAELVACEVLLASGFEVFRNVATRGAHDIVVMLPGNFKAIPIDVTYSSRKYLDREGRINFTSAARSKLASRAKACILLVTEDREVWEATADFSREVYEGDFPWLLKYELFTPELFLRRIL